MRGWEQPDFVLVTGDAYVDHPSFGTAIIGRVLEDAGFKVAILAQPQWKNSDDFKRFGKPRLGFLINSGTVDSMVANYTASKKKRRTDSLTPGGQNTRRPDRSVIVYTNRAKEAYKNIPVIIGGIEASLRRLSHYDYWDNKVRRSILLDSKADLLIYGMGERAIVEIAQAMNDGFEARDINWIKGTVVRESDNPSDFINSMDGIILPSFDATSDKTNKTNFLESYKIQYENNDHISGKPLYEKYSDKLYVKQNIPQEPLTTEELDKIYELPFTYEAHPMYKGKGIIPALHEIKFSIAANRGCFGNCSFCAITNHQGRVVTGRSKDSVIREAKLMTGLKDFKGYIHDVGGPTANFRKPACNKQTSVKAGVGTCMHRDCLYPEPCPNLDIDHSEYLDILRSVRELPEVKKVFIRSGIRYDYVVADKKTNFMKELCKHHVSGTLKVAPEHISPSVLKAMRKPGKNIYEDFRKKYFEENKRLEKEQYLIPYFISSHPGATMNDAIELAVYLKETGFVPDQVQDFYPTPGTLATAIYYAGRDPLTGENVYVPKDVDERKMQRALLQFNKKENKSLVLKALKESGRADLIKFFYGNDSNHYSGGRRGGRK